MVGIFFKQCFNKNPSVVTRNIDGVIILVPSWRDSEKTPSIYLLNDLGLSIWVLINGKRTTREISELIVGNQRTKVNKKHEDIAAFLGQLEDIGLIIK